VDANGAVVIGGGWFIVPGGCIDICKPYSVGEEEEVEEEDKQDGDASIDLVCGVVREPRGQSEWPATYFIRFRLETSPRRQRRSRLTSSNSDFLKFLHGVARSVIDE
jgi:hypothetical protein